MKLDELTHLYKVMLECIATNNYSQVPCHIADDLLDLGWIKPAAWAEEKGLYTADWIRRWRAEMNDDIDLTAHYVLTDKGRQVWERGNVTQSTFMHTLRGIFTGLMLRIPRPTADKLREFGWIETTDDGLNSQRWIEIHRRDSDDHDESWWYLLTKKGHMMLTAPRENRVIELCVPFFPAAGVRKNDEAEAPQSA